MTNPGPDPRVRTIALGGGQSWLARTAFALVGVALLVAAFFFMAFALAAGAIVGSAIAVRWWWRNRNRRGDAGDGVVEGEYVVVERETRVRIEPPQPPAER